MTAIDSFRLDGKVAVVTGGNRGLGHAFVRALREAGARVAIAARDQSRSERVADELGATAVATRRHRPRERRGHARHRDGGARPGRCLGEQRRRLLPRPGTRGARRGVASGKDVNVDGLWRCSRIVGAQMAARRAGVIVNIGSLSALVVNRPQMQPAYNASKAAVHQLTKSLAAEWAPFGVRGGTRSSPRLRQDRDGLVDLPEFRRHWIDDAPMRYALPEELGPSLLLATRRASRLARCWSSTAATRSGRQPARVQSEPF